MTANSELLVLHSLRIQGMADTARAARRFALDPAAVEELLLDAEAFGWVQRVGFADLTGWALTESGRNRGSQLLADELDRTGARAAVTAAYGAFLTFNARFLTVITKWQIRPTAGDPMAANDHSDWRWDEDVRKSLAGLVRRVRPITDDLEQALPRFASYPQRMTAALERADRGERKWIDGPRIDSCHTAWFELHEDLLATLGLQRGHGGDG